MAGNSRLASRMHSGVHTLVMHLHRHDEVRRRGRRYTLALLIWSFSGVLLLAAPQAMVRSGQAVAGTSSDEFRWEAWTTRDGLPQNSVTDIVQTQDGYLWLGTHAGLARFDGVRFTVFDTANTPALTDNRVMSIVAGRNGELWIGTERGGIIRLQDGVFERVLDGLTTGPVRQITQSTDGSIWFGGTHLKQLNGSKLVDYEARVPGQFDCLTHLGANDWWLSWSRDGEPKESVDSSRQCAWGDVLSDEAQARTLTTLEGATLIRICGGVTESRTLAGDIPAGIYATAVDKSGIRWIGAKNGLFQLIEDSGKDEVIARSIAPEGGLGEVQSLLADRDGNIWAGTRRLGLLRIRPQAFDFYEFPAAGHPRWAMNTQAPEQFGTHLIFGDRLVYTFAAGGWMESSVPAEITGIVRAAAGLDGQLWLAHAGGRRLSSLRGDHWEHHSANLGTIRAIAGKDGGGVWAVSESRLYSLVDGTIGNPVELPDRLRNSSRAVLAEASSGSLYLGVSGEVYRYRARDFERIRTGPDASRLTELRFIHERANGQVWISTYGAGLVCVADGRPTRIGKAQGLPDHSLGRIIEDESGRLWVNSNRGVIVLSPDAVQRFLAGEDKRISCHLLPTGEGNGTAGARLSGGRLLFPTVTGVVLLDPHSTSHRDVASPIAVIEQVVGDGLNEQRVGNRRITPMSLSGGRRDVDFVFTALSFRQPKDLLFEYRLKGYHEEWINSGARRRASYTNLPPGDYSFEVRARNNGESWSEIDAVQLQVPERYYETTWFQGSIGLAAILAMGVGYRYRIRSVHRQNASLRRANQQTEQALTGANVGTWECDLLAQLFDLDAQASRILALSPGPSQRLAADLLDAVHVNDIPAVTAARDECRTGKADAWEVQYRLARLPGVWVHEQGQVVAFGSGGLPVRASGTLRDITSEKEASDRERMHIGELAHTARIETGGQMATRIAHELNQPLSAIALYCATLEHLAESPEENSEQLRLVAGRVNEQAMRSGEILRWLRTFIGRGDSAGERTTLSSVVRDVCRFLDVDLRLNSIDTRLHLNDGGAEVLIDRVQIQQVLVNLIHNSIDATKDQSTRSLQISIEVRDGEVCLTMTDNGRGLPTVEPDRIFESFYSTKEGAMGMGLAISRTVITAHRGRLWACTAESGGATLCFSLPVAGPPGE